MEFVHHEMARFSFSEIPPPNLGGIRRQKRPFERMVTLLFEGGGAEDATEARAKTKVNKRATTLNSMFVGTTVVREENIAKGSCC